MREKEGAPVGGIEKIVVVGAAQGSADEGDDVGSGSLISKLSTGEGGGWGGICVSRSVQL